MRKVWHYFRYTIIRCKTCKYHSRKRGNRVWCSDACWANERSTKYKPSRV